MKVLVTGGSGFIGSHIVERLLTNGHDVIIIDKADCFIKGIKFYKSDITDSKALESVFKREKPDIVDHHIAQVNPRKSVENPIMDANVNIIGSLNLLECCRKYNVKKIIYASTNAIYGEPKYLPVDEKHPIKPVSPYGVSKYVVEHYLNVFHHIYGLDYTILRYSNVYGPRQDPKKAGVVAIFTTMLLKNKKPTIFGNGGQIRDYVYIDDIVNANMLALKSGNNEIFNIGTGVGTSVKDIFKMVKKTLNSYIDPIYGEEKMGDLAKIYLNIEKAKNVLGWEPTISLDDGIQKTVEFYKLQK